jgi:hypothetical protein
VPRTRTVVVPAVALMLILGSCSGGVKDPALDQTARDIVAMFLGYNCDHLPRGRAPGEPAGTLHFGTSRLGCSSGRR